MAKKEEQNEEQMPEAENVQQPEDPKPKKKKKGLSLPLIIGISLAALIILVGGTLGAVYIMVSNMVQNTNTEQTQNGGEAKENENKEQKIEEDFSVDENYSYLKNVVKNQSKNIRYMELGEIITNPKNSGQFVVMDIGIEFVAYDENGEVLPVTEGGEEESSFFKENQLAKLRGRVNNVLWSMSVEELQQKRSKMPGVIENKFEPVFKKNRAVIKEVVILRFIIQGG